MASQYALDQREFYEDCREDGGPIKILRPKSTQIDNSDPSSVVVDPSFWEGNSDLPLETPTFALFDQGASAVNPYTKAFIPSFGLNFPIVKGLLVKDEMGNVSVITDVSELKPDGALVIFYECNLEGKPGPLNV